MYLTAIVVLTAIGQVGEVTETTETTEATTIKVAATRKEIIIIIIEVTTEITIVADLVETEDMMVVELVDYCKYIQKYLKLLESHWNMLHQRPIFGKIEWTRIKILLQ